MKKIILILIAVISVSIVVYLKYDSNKTTLPHFVKSTQNNNAVASDKYSGIDDILKIKKHTFPTVSDSKICSIEIYNLQKNTITSFKEYTASENDSFEISIKKEETFIISLPTYPTVTYSWKVLNSINNNLLTLDHTSAVLLESDDSNNDPYLCGGGHSLQNFYFSALNSGSQVINFELNSDAYKSTDNFKINFNITIGS